MAIATGGINNKEIPKEALKRELYEEVGIKNFEILDYIPKFNKYNAPKWARLIQGYKGQVQDLFVIKLTNKSIHLVLDQFEFSDYCFVDSKNALKLIDSNRKDSLNRAIKIAEKKDFYKLIKIINNYFYERSKN